MKLSKHYESLFERLAQCLATQPMVGGAVLCSPSQLMDYKTALMTLLNGIVNAPVVLEERIRLRKASKS